MGLSGNIRELNRRTPSKEEISNQLVIDIVRPGDILRIHRPSLLVKHLWRCAKPVFIHLRRPREKQRRSRIGQHGKVMAARFAPIDGDIKRHRLGGLIDFRTMTENYTGIGVIPITQEKQERLAVLCCQAHPDQLTAIHGILAIHRYQNLLVLRHCRTGTIGKQASNTRQQGNQTICESTAYLHGDQCIKALPDGKASRRPYIP